MNNTLMLNNSERQKLLSIIHELFELENLELDDKTILRELTEIDSLKVFQLLGKIEIDFCINLGFESIDQVETVADLYTIIAKAQKEKR